MSLHGQELNPESYAICKADMLIKGQDVTSIKLGNTLSDDQLADSRFDFMLSNPPFGVEWKKVQKQITDEHIAQFATESTWDGLSDALHERYGHTATRLVLYNALADPERLERYGAVAQRLSAPR